MGFLWLFARRFVAGETLEAALLKIKEINDKGLLTTVDILGESITERADAESYRDNYINLLRVADRERLDGNISIKPTMMGLDIDDEFCYANVKRLLEEADKLGSFVRIDMEGSPHTDRTLELLYRLRRDHDNVGIVVQAMLRRTAEDIRLLNERGVSVRLCKGAYKEPKEIAFKRMRQIRENFKELTKTLLRDGTYPAIATHDGGLIRWTKEWAAEQGIGKDSFEFQMLYGLRGRTQVELAREGYKMRVYVPYGTEWFPYFYRRLRERKENVFFIAKTFFKP